MTALLTQDTEVRHLADHEKKQLASCLSYSQNVERFMLMIPQDVEDCGKEVNDYEKKYNESHFR